MARYIIQSFPCSQRICMLCMLCAIIVLYAVSSTALAQDDVTDTQTLIDPALYPQTHSELRARVRSGERSVRSWGRGQLHNIWMRPYDFALLCRDLALNERQHTLAAVFYDEYRQTIEEINRAVNEREPRFVGPTDQNSMSHEEMSAMWAEIAAVDQRRLPLIRATFPAFEEALELCLESVHALLDDDQLERWPAARMALRRMMWLNLRIYRDTASASNNLGVIVDLNWLFHDEAQPNGLLHELLGKIDPPDEHWRAAREQAQLITTEYNHELDDLLRRDDWSRLSRYLALDLERAHISGRVPWDQREAWMWDQYMTMWEPLRQHQVRIMNLNDRTMQRIAQLLRTVSDPEHAERWIDAVYAMQYPMLYGDEQVYLLERQYQAARTREDLDERTRERLLAIYADYDRRRRPLLRQAAGHWYELWRETAMRSHQWGRHPHMHAYFDILRQLEPMREEAEGRMQRILFDAGW